MSWQLDNYSDNIDTSEIGGAIQYRHHWLFSRYDKIHASEAFDSEVGQTTSQIDYWVGDQQKMKTMVGQAGSAKYVCIEDGISPEQPGSPGNYVIRRQTYEYYSAWDDVPTEWGWSTQS